MRKIIFIFLLLMAFMLMACSQDAAAGRKLEGTWSRTDGNREWRMTFRSDGWMSLEEMEDGKSVSTDNYRWRTEGDMIILSIGPVEDAAEFSMPDNDTLICAGKTYKRV